MLKSLDLALHQARLDLLVAGLIGSVAAVLLLWGLGNAMYGESEGYLSALVLAANPVFWYAGLANPVRTYLAVISIATAWAGWSCLHKQSSSIWLYAMGASLGLLSWFRPETLILLAPLFIGAGLKARVGAVQFVLAALLLAACAGSWVLVLVYKAGGPRPFLELYLGYLMVNSQDYTLAFGASRTAALETVRRSLAWNFLPAIPWAWAILFAWPHASSAVSRGRGWFMAVWFLPPFLFHALVHLRDMDQTLVTAPVVCLLGGWALARVKWRKWRVATPAAAAVMLGLSFYCFRRPPVADLKLASNGTVRYANDWMRATLAAVDALQTEGPLAIVCYGSIVSSRQISYYYPDTPVLYLPGIEKGSENISPFWTLHRRTIAAGDPITLPESGNIAWSGSPGTGMREAVTGVAPVRELGPLIVTHATEGSQFRIGKWNLLSAQP
jgi:4-amino-4-deoxy-L-arabinose transferase-like glycosyltransferase